MLRFAYIVTYLSLFLLLCQPEASSAQQFNLSTKKKQAWLRFTPVRDMIILPVMINNRGPFNFVLDSGVGLMVITEPSLVDSIVINYKRTIKLYGAGNLDNFEAYATSPLDITIGEHIKSERVSAAILKKDHFSLSSYAGMKIHGLLGYEFFANLAVKINFIDSTMIVGRPGRFKPFRKGVVLPISIEERKPYFTTSVLLPDGCAANNKFVIDLGAGHALLLENRQEYKYELPRSIQANLGLGFTGPLNGQISRINEIDIGKYKLKDVVTSFPDTGKRLNFIVKRDGNLGLGILKKFSFVLDYANSVMYLKPNYKLKEPFEHDMSGLEYYASGNDLRRILISRVEPGSAGDEAGISANDEITSINFRSVSKMSMVEIDNIFRSRDNRNILVEVYHEKDKKYETVVLTLKRRI
jgi:hypothetical protein